MSSYTKNKLEYLKGTKQLIREAIEEKGQTVTDGDSFRSYVDKIANIKTGVDVSGVTATAPHVLEGDVFVDADGNPVNGTMKNNGAVLKKLRYSGYDEKYTYTIPEGYHDGTGIVEVRCDSEQIVYPSKYRQRLYGTPIRDNDWNLTGYNFLGHVVIDPIPDQYQDVTPVTATAADVRQGKVIVDAQGNEVVGTLVVEQKAPDVIWVGKDSVASALVGTGVIRYVTFCNHDGTETYGQKSVIAGENCVDPVTAGHMDAPTRESTAQYNYTFSGGWATEPGGGINADALKNVTEDRTVYANFIAAVRYYTITYYDSDGTTVLKTESLAYGATPSYKPSKEGYEVGGWIPEITAVTGDAGYTVQWEELSGLYLQSKASNVPYSAYDFVITNDGKHVVYTVSNTSLTNLNGFDTSAEVATSILLSTNGVAYQGYIDILEKNGYIMMLGGTRSSSGTGIIIKTSFDGAADKYTPQLGTLSVITCSPTSDLYCYEYSKSGKPTIRFSDNYEISLSDLSSTYVLQHGRITKDDKHFVCAAFSRPVGVYDISKRSAIELKKSITPSGSVNSLSVSSDGTKMLFATASSPYVTVYSLETYEKICDFSGILTGSAYATFVGDLVVTAQGSTVRAFEIVDSAPVEFFNIPAYSGGTVSRIESSHNGNFVAIYSDNSDQFEVWGKA